MDDLAIFTTGSFEKHLEALRDVLSVLSSENFRINKSKCTFAAASVNCLGHTVTTKGIKPQLQKISTILNLQAPTNVKQLRSFTGLVNYYRDFIPQRSHVLAPLTSLTSPKIPFHWSTSCQAAFKKIRWQHPPYSPSPTHTYPSSSNPTQATTSWEASSVNILLSRQLTQSSKLFLKIQHLRSLMVSTQSPFLVENYHPLTEIIPRWKTSYTVSSKLSSSTAPSYAAIKF